MSADKVGYLELLRTNRSYRRLWLGDIASLLGDWFNTIAQYTLMRQLTGSTLALGLVFVTKMLPFALASPVAGLLTDRWNRRRLMIAADLVRALVVLGFLAIDGAEDLPLFYALSALQVMIGAFFIPARSASIPNITSPKELLTANALSAATWSVLLALGAALGGFATDRLGTDAVFLIDSASYLVSAFFIWRTVIPQSTDAPSHGPVIRTAWNDIVAGWRHLRDSPRIGRIALTKPAWSLAGAGLVYLLALVGEELMPAAPAVGMGVLFAIRGLGTGCGPIAARTLFPDERRWPALIGSGIVASGLAYIVLGQLPWTLWILLPVFLAHTPSGANWVLSTVLLQKRTADRFRGRIFSTEWLLLTLVDTVTILAASLLLELEVLSLRGAITAFAGLQILTGIAWWIWIVPAERAQAAPSESPLEDAHDPPS
ncbi:MAG: MFS transporter [Acidobacteriota bacterium]